MREISRLIGRDLKALQLDELRRCAPAGEMGRERRPAGRWRCAAPSSEGGRERRRLHRPSAAQKQQQIAELEEGAEKGASFPVTACGSNIYCTNSGK